MTMRCGTRALSLVSLGFGLVATGALSLAVATDYWLFTVEQVIPKLDLSPNDTLMMEAAAAAAAAAYEELQLDDDVADVPADDLPPVGPDGSPMLGPILISMHSGLWRLCIITDPPGTVRPSVRRTVSIRHLYTHLLISL